MIHKIEDFNICPTILHVDADTDTKGLAIALKCSRAKSSLSDFVATRDIAFQKYILFPIQSVALAYYADISFVKWCI